LAVLNRVGQQLQQVLQLVAKKEEEIKKFTEYCTKNNIDYPPKQTTPPQLPKEGKIAPPTDTKK